MHTFWVTTQLFKLPCTCLYSDEAPCPDASVRYIELLLLLTPVSETLHQCLHGNTPSKLSHCALTLIIFVSTASNA